jgi:Type I restriction enzyme R protein N terminus (HSDR_N)
VPKPSFQSRDKEVDQRSTSEFRLKRELLRARKSFGIARLDAFVAATPGRYLPLSDKALRLAADLWARSRQEGQPTADLARLRADIYGNRDFLAYLRNQGKFFCDEEGRELDLQLIDYADAVRPSTEWRNAYEVTEEFYAHNGRYGTREDVVFLINGIPILVVECKNASKNEAIALGIDQIRRYHVETPEVMVPEMLFTATEAIGFSYGVTWNTVRRNIFNWKHEQIGQLEAKVKSFCEIPHVLRLLTQMAKLSLPRSRPATAQLGHCVTQSRPTRRSPSRSIENCII